MSAEGMVGRADMVVASMWDNRIRWSRAADSLKRRIVRARAAVLCLSSAGAIAATLAATLLETPGAPRVVAATTGAVCLGLATVVSAMYLTAEAIRRWTRARATSEGIKQLVFRYRAGALPDRCGSALDRLQEEYAEIEEASEDLLAIRAGLTFEVPAAPGPMSPQQYVRDRVEAQLSGYYLPRAEEHLARARRLRRLALTLSVVTAIVAAVAAGAAAQAGASPSGLAPWVAVLTTLGGAVAAHRAACRYDFLAMSFAATAARLQRHLNRWRSQGSPTDPASWTRFVDDCENAISAENASWMAKWSERTPTQPDSG
ncbi:hypothetical protein GCM10023094_21400 [Rhodococcus olei]|uniref:SMODS and SLOG-associating 2TM effector domain-containing protein n=1 Tax=Rhodococcus olei TaxID=2161675 RepID=A0ABP8P247_9NOCA